MFTPSYQKHCNKRNFYNGLLLLRASFMQSLKLELQARSTGLPLDRLVEIQY